MYPINVIFSEPLLTLLAVLLALNVIVFLIAAWKLAFNKGKKREDFALPSDFHPASNGTSASKPFSGSEDETMVMERPGSLPVDPETLTPDFSGLSHPSAREGFAPKEAPLHKELEASHEPIVKGWEEALSPGEETPPDRNAAPLNEWTTPVEKLSPPATPAAPPAPAATAEALSLRINETLKKLEAVARDALFCKELTVALSSRMDDIDMRLRGFPLDFDPSAMDKKLLDVYTRLETVSHQSNARAEIEDFRQKIIVIAEHLIAIEEEMARLRENPASEQGGAPAFPDDTVR